MHLIGLLTTALILHLTRKSWQTVRAGRQR